MSAGDLFVNGEPFNLDGGAGGAVVPPDSGGAGEGGATGGEGGAGTGEGKGDPWAAVQSLTAQIEKQNRIIEELRKPPTPDVPTTVQPGVPQDMNAVKAQLEKQFLSDPGGTLLQMMAIMGQQAQASALQSVGVVKEQLLEDAIETFKDRQRSDPAFAAVEAEFDKVVAEELKNNRGSVQNLTPAQIKTGIKSMYELAAGRVALERSRRRENEPPAYNFGSVGGTGTLRGSGGGGKLTKAQQAVYDSAVTDHGYSPEDALKIAQGAEVE